MWLSTQLKSQFEGKTVLITGGTRGIGLNLGLSFARYGAQCILTYNWGGHDEQALHKQFEALQAPPPLFVQADAGNDEDTRLLIDALEKKFSGVDIFISNVSLSLIVKSFEDYSLRALKKSISYSSWPLVSYFKQIKEVFGRYPKYTIGVSSTGPDHYSYGYDFVAASKAVMEVLCRYLSYRLKEEDVVINAVRSRAIKTEAFSQTFGEEFEAFANAHVPDNYWIECQEVSNAILALCSGYCDAIKGQVITVDRGTSFFDNMMDLYARNNNQVGR